MREFLGIASLLWGIFSSLICLFNLQLFIHITFIILFNSKCGNFELLLGTVSVLSVAWGWWFWKNTTLLNHWTFLRIKNTWRSEWTNILMAVIVLLMINFSIHLNLLNVFDLHFHIVVINWIPLIIRIIIKYVIFRLNLLFVYFWVDCVRVNFDLFDLVDRGLSGFFWGFFSCWSQSFSPFFSPLFKFLFFKSYVHFLEFQIFYTCDFLGRFNFDFLLGFVFEIVVDFGGLDLTGR